MRHNILLLLLLVAVSTQARKRDFDALCRAAERVLATQTNVRADKKGGVQPRIALLHEYERCAVLGYPTGGFALIANDDEVEPVLAYSESVYDSTALPAPVQWYVNNVQHALRNAPRYERSSTYSYNTTGVDYVLPMCSTEWGQDEPYNLKCPRKLKGKGYMMTGCVATAMAQIMKYWNYPEHGEGSMFNMDYFLYANFNDTYYGWPNMLDVYSGATYGTAQSDAVAQLMMHCGMSVNMSYGDSESGAQSQHVPTALRDYFRFNRNVGYRNRANHTNAEWMASIYRELAAGRPILYTGQDNKMSYGHAFVFDGYDEDGMVHVNWGWDGKCNGYFDINLLNSGYMGMSFTDLQSMVIGIGMPEDDIEHSVELAIRKSLSLYGSGNSYQLYDEDFTVYNLNDYDLKGTIALVMPTQTNIRTMAVIASYPGTNENTGEEQESFQSFTYINYPGTYKVTIPNTLRNGTYCMYLAFREEGYSHWQPLYNAEGTLGYFVIKKQGTSIDVVGVEGQYTTAVESVKPERTAPKGTYNLQGQRVGENYRGVVVKNGKLRIKN